MGTLAAVGVDDDFTARQACVAVGATDDELARRVNVVLDVEAEEVEHLLRVYMLLHPWHEDVDDIVLDAGQHPFVRVEFVVLGRDDDGVDALGNAFIAILHGNLALGVRTQVGHLFALLADVGQCAHDEVSQVERDGHIALRLVGGVTEHHTLVAGTLFVLILAVDATVDVLALFMEDAA